MLRFIIIIIIIIIHKEKEASTSEQTPVTCNMVNDWRAYISEQRKLLRMTRCLNPPEACIDNQMFSDSQIWAIERCLIIPVTVRLLGGTGIYNMVQTGCWKADKEMRSQEIGK